MEIWKQIENTIYECNNLGNFRRKTKDIKKRSGEYLYLNGYKNSRGYIQICCPKRKLAHRIIAKIFIENPLNKIEINHINGIRHDNRVENLEWATRSENQLHAFKIGLQKPLIRYGKNNPCSKPIVQYDLQGNFIKEWNNSYEVKRKLNICASSITENCKNKRKTAGGYIWKYK